MKLYELTGKIKELEAILADSGGEISDEMIKEMEETQASLEEKVEGYMKVLATLLSNSTAADDEVRRLKTIATRYKNAHTRLKSYLLMMLEEVGINKVETPFGTCSIRTAGVPKLVLKVGVDDLPDDLCKFSREPDNEKIRSAVEEKGGESEYAELHKSTYLRIS